MIWTWVKNIILCIKTLIRLSIFKFGNYFPWNLIISISLTLLRIFDTISNHNLQNNMYKILELIIRNERCQFIYNKYNNDTNPIFPCYLLSMFCLRKIHQVFHNQKPLWCCVCMLVHVCAYVCVPDEKCDIIFNYKNWSKAQNTNWSQTGTFIIPETNLNID